jgi:hypothetical protein
MFDRYVPFLSNSNMIRNLLPRPVALRLGRLSARFMAIRTYAEARAWKADVERLYVDVKAGATGEAVGEKSAELMPIHDPTADLHDELVRFMMQLMELLPSDAKQKESLLHRLRRQRKEIAAEKRNLLDRNRILKTMAGKGIIGFLSHRLEALWSGNRHSAEQDPEMTEAE